MIYVFLTVSLESNDRNAAKFIFCNVIGCSNELYNSMHIERELSKSEVIFPVKM